MNITIESSLLKAEISTLGAEIQHLVRKSDGTQLVWNGSPTVWKNHAPILFPYVGRSINGFYTIDGTKYENTTNHGFARNLETKVILQEKNKVVFELTENETTLARYPYKFSLQTTYEITDSGLNWKINVINKDTKPMSFSVGTHTAFSCPSSSDPEGTKISDYVIEFEKKEELKTVVINEKGYLVTKDGNYQTAMYDGKEKGIVRVTEKGFGVGLCITDFKSDWIGLRNTKTNSLIKISTKGFPHCMLWQNDKEEPQFVCIEPWYGLPDADCSDGNWEKKIAINTIAPGESFESIQNISIGE